MNPEGSPVMVRIPPDPAMAPERRNWQATWPRQDYLELAAVPDAVPGARHHVRLVLKEWQAGELAADIELVVSELVSNAVAATAAIQWAVNQPPVRLWLLDGVVLAMVVVWDASTAVPVPRMPTQEDESGRGLQLVGALARWGYYLPSPEHGGKVVHAVLPK
jgi:anti-sigma regulatory factor (Ser/Thr protein kinase)